MRDTFTIDNFDAGLVSNPDMQDIPQNAAVFSRNVDPDVSEGVLQSVKKPSTIATICPDVKRSVWLQQDSTKYDLVFIGASDHPHSTTDFYGSPSETDHDSTACTCLAVNNKEVHIGRGTSNAPKWLGYISHGQFGGSAPSGLQFVNAEVSSNPGETSGKIKFTGCSYHTHAAVESDFFQFGKFVSYKTSCVYDGYQESALISDSWMIAPIPLTDGNSADYCTVSIKITGYTSLPKRITAVNLYRSEYNSDGFGEFRLVKSFDINDALWTTSGSDKTLSYQDTGTFKYTYYESTGLPDTLESTIVNYTLSTIVNGYLIAGNCYQDSLGTQDRVLFRSKYLRHDTFDWVNDQLRLPFIPKAMAGFNGRLYVWGDNKTVVVEPESFQIENIFEGIGCYSDKSFVVTDYGLFWADRNGAYLSTGENPKLISSPIRLKQYGTGTCWNDLFGSLSGDTFSVVFSSQKKIVIFCESLTGRAFTYHLPKRRWDYWEITYTGVATTNSSLFTGKDGEVYYSNGVQLHKLWNSSNYETMLWISVEFAPDSSQAKKFYKVLTDSSNITTTYGCNGASPTSSLTNGALASEHRKAKSLQVQLITTSANTVSTVYGLGIIYRALIGKR